MLEVTAAVTPKGERRRYALVSAAADLLCEGGFDAVRHRAVARRAGLPLASTTYYFSSLDDLIAKAVEHVGNARGRTVAARVAALSRRRRGAESTADVLVDLLVGEANGLRVSEQLISRYERYIACARQPGLRDMQRRILQQRTDAVVEVVERSGRAVRAELLTALVCAVDGAVVAALVGDGDGPRATARATLIDVIDVLAPIDGFEPAPSLPVAFTCVTDGVVTRGRRDGADDGGRRNNHELKRVMGPGLLLLFVVGDILGTGVYALTGDVAAEVGGAAWVPFLVAFLIATVTAFSYLELVTKYPQAAGAALYAHKAFGIQFVTFLVAFVVMCSGITSASTASRFFAANFFKGVRLRLGHGRNRRRGAAVHDRCLRLVNLRGVGESVKLNVVLTIIEITGLVMVILVGLWAFTGGADVDFSRVVAFDTAGDKNAFMAVTAATSLAFFAMVGFEDSVNMAEETKDPVRIFPKMLLTGLTIAGIVYILVSIVAVALVPIGELEASDTPLVEVVKAGAPGLPIDKILPFITMFAVSNTALINMLMASRLIYGMARQHVLPPVLGRVHPRTHSPWVAIMFTTRSRSA